MALKNVAIITEGPGPLESIGGGHGGGAEPLVKTYFVIELMATRN